MPTMIQYIDKPREPKLLNIGEKNQLQRPLGGWIVGFKNSTKAKVNAPMPMAIQNLFESALLSMNELLGILPPTLTLRVHKLKELSRKVGWGSNEISGMEPVITT